MKKMNKKSQRKLAIVISIIIGILVTLVVNFNSSTFKDAFTVATPTQEDYDALKEYTLKVVKGESYEEKDIEVKKNLEKEILEIKVEKSKVYGVEARFPVSTEKDLEIANGTLIYEASIDCENVTYVEYTLIKTRSQIIIIDLLLVVLLAIVFYVIFYWNPKEWEKVKNKENWP